MKTMQRVDKKEKEKLWVIVEIIRIEKGSRQWKR